MFRFASPKNTKAKLFRGILLVWFCFLVRGLFYAEMIPMWEGFDEHVHFAYIQHILYTGTLPDSTDPISMELEESLKLVPVPWLLRDVDPSYTTHDRYWQLSNEARQQSEEALHNMPRAWGGKPGKYSMSIYEAQQPPLYYWLMSMPLRATSGFSLPARVFLIRMLSLLLASLAIPVGFLLVKRVLQNREAALGIVALISIMPGLMADVCRVGNDSLAMLLYTVTVYATLLFVENPRIPGRGLLLACSMGMGLLTKAYFLTALPALAAVVILALRRRKGRDLLIRGLTVGIGALALSAWWYVRNYLLTGAWSGLMQDVSLKNVSFFELVKRAADVDWANALKSTLLSHIWFGNWSFLQVRSWMYQVFQYMGTLALVGLLTYWIRALVKRLPETLPQPGHLMVLFSYYFFFCIGICYHVLITFVVHDMSSSAGWYFYSLSFPQPILILVGISVLIPQGTRLMLIPAASISFGLLDIYTVHFISIPYYVGLIRHKANGFLETFYVNQIRDIGIWNIFERISTNGIFSSPLPAMMLWLCYLAATGILVAIILKIAKGVRLYYSNTTAP